MKITIVLNTSWNLYNFRRGLIDALRQEGHTVTLVAPEDEYADQLRALGYDLVTVGMNRRGINPVQDIAYFWQLYRIYQSVRPDLTLHFTVKPNLYGTLAAWLLGIKIINTVSGLGTVFLKKGVASVVAQLLYRITFRLPDHVFFHNPDDHQLFTSKGLISAAKATVVPGSGIDLDRFSPSFQPSLSSKPFTFLVISRLLYDKGIVEYAAAARQLRQQGLVARFQLLGARDPQHKRGIPDATVDRWIADQLIDYQGTTDDVRPFIEQADVVVLPSYREGLPRTLLEAASLQKPIITTDVPGCRHVVTDGRNGLLCQARDAADLARKMQQLRDTSPEKRRAMGEAGRAIVQAQFSERYVVNQYVSTLEPTRRVGKLATG